jgi:acetoin utilization protein AcuB
MGVGMRHPKRTISRDIRTRRPLHPGREGDELEDLTWPESIRVKDRMTQPVVTTRADTLVRVAADLMRTRKLRHLPVVDRGGRPVGIVTDRDLRQIIFDPAMQERLGGQPEALKTLTVRDIMTWGVVTVGRNTDIREAARLMHERKIGALPVVGGEKVVGILTESDVVKTFVDVLGEGYLARPYRWAFAYR